MRLHQAKQPCKPYLSTTVISGAEDEKLSALASEIQAMQTKIVQMLMQRYTRCDRDDSQSMKNFEVLVSLMTVEVNAKLRVSAVQTDFEIVVELQCKHCQRSFTTQQRLDRHVNAHHTPRIVCCQRGFRDEFAHWLHTEIAHRRRYTTFDGKQLCVYKDSVNTSYCRKRFADLQVFQAHLERNHLERLQALKLNMLVID